MAREDYVASLERSLLGIILLDPARLREAERLVESTDFADPRHGRFYAAAVELAHRGGDSSALGVGLELKRLGTIEEGDEGALSAIVGGATADPNATKELARRVREESVRRGALAALEGSGKDLTDRSKALVDTLGDLRRSISELERAEGVEELPPIAAAVDEILATLDTGIDPGTPTGLPPLDTAIQGGIKPSQLIVLAGGTGSGKTSLATQIALSAADYAKRRGKGYVLIFSMEMSAPELVIRMVSQVVAIRDGHRPPDGFSRRDRERVREGLAKIRALPLRVEVPRQSTVSFIRGAIERHVGEHGAPALVIVDHIGLMKDPRVKGGRTEEVGSITRNLKELAMQLEVPVLALAQLNREAGKRDGQKPQLTDLRECLAPETRILDATSGTFVTIAELAERGSVEVVAMDRRTLKLTTAPAAVVSSGEKDLFRLTTRTGRTIRASADHMFLTADRWTPLCEIEQGSVIAVPRAYRFGGDPDAISADRARLVGYLIGDGTYLRHREIGFISADPATLEDVRDICTREFGLTPRDKAHWSEIGQLSIAVEGQGRRSNPVADWLGALGMRGQKGPDKRVPDAIFRATPEVIAECLAGLFATDGTVKTLGGPSNRQVCYTSTSRGLLHDIQHLLLRLGIQSVIGKPTRHTKSTVDIATLVIAGKEHVGRFAALVPVRGVKAARLADHAAWAAKGLAKSLRQIDRLPLEYTELIATVQKFTGLTHRQLGYRPQGKRMDRPTMARVAEVLDDDGLRLLAASDLLWDEVVSIVPAGREATYDLQVEGPHNFVAEDLLVHNSGSIEQDANIVMFVHRPSYSNTNLEERRIQEEQGAQAFVLIAKNRSGPTAEVEFAWVGPRYTFGLTETYMAANPGMIDTDALIDHSRPSSAPPADPTDYAPADPIQPGELAIDPGEVAAALTELETTPVFDPDEDLFA